MIKPRAFPSIERELSPMFVPPWAAVTHGALVLLGMPMAALAGFNGAFIIVAVVVSHLVLALVHRADDQWWPALIDDLIELAQTRREETWVA